MLGWLSENLANIAVCGVVVLICAWILIKEIRTRKCIKAAGGIGGGCSCCPGGCPGCSLSHAANSGKVKK